MSRIPWNWWLWAMLAIPTVLTVTGCSQGDPVISPPEPAPAIADDWQVLLEPSYTHRAMWVAESGQAWACNQGGQILHNEGDGWHVVYENDLGVITGLWGFSETDIYAAQPSGMLHFDGTSWLPFATPPQTAILELWGTADGTLFGAGSDGAIVRWRTESWEIMESGTTHHFRSLWGTGPDHVLALDSSGALHRYDGEVWAEVEGMPAERGLDVWASAPDHIVMAIGNGAIQFDGTSWQAINDLPAGIYTEVWGTGIDDIFLVGKDFAHHDGGGWTIQEKPTRSTLDVIHGNSTGIVHAAGLLGEVWIWESGTWVEQVPIGKSQWFTDIWGSSDESLFVTCGDFSAVFFWDGMTWTPQDLPASSPQPMTVWGTSSTDVHVAGYGHHILHFNGVHWSSQELDRFYGIHDLWGFSGSNAFAVGHDLDGHGRILVYDGLSWTALDETWEQGLLAIGGTGPDNIYVSRDGASFLHFDGTDWSPAGGHTLFSAESVWIEETVGFGVGKNGSVQVLKNGVWEIQASGVTNDLEAVWGNGNGGAIAVGTDGLILHYNGREWSTATSPRGDNLHGLWGFSDGSAYSAGRNGVLLKNKLDD